MPALTRLRIAGFKSFAEAAMVELRPGLTGVVGPNGCGKSNVVEALRWAMGEANARTLRGAEMDDVIFAGTGLRAARNIAEVTIVLEDTAGLLPGSLAGAAELEVVRRIERGGGSQYRVNGHELRARDVQTLFADLASGARASAMVSQGRVAALIAARPEERRQLLEEAAGITGLHSRRAEAVTRLRAAELNLERAGDARAAREAELATLRRQARQAARARALGDEAATAEAALLALQQARAVLARLDALDALARAEASVDQASANAALSAEAAHEAAALLPALRDAETAARDALERARIARQGVAVEAARAEAARAEAERRWTQLSRDLAHAESQSTAAVAAEARLRTEAAQLAAAQDDAPAQLAHATAAAASTAKAAQDAEAAAAAAIERSARLVAEQAGALQARRLAGDRARRAEAEHRRLEAEQHQAAAATLPAARLAAAEAALAAAEAQLADANDAADRAERLRADRATAAAAAHAARGPAEAALSACLAELRALEEVLATRPAEGWAPVMDRITVPPGLEAAVAAALGDGLTAAEDASAGRHWRALPAPLVTAGTLAELVAAPPALARALAAVALVASPEAGQAAQPSLAPGRSVVTREGGLWRWDGYAAAPGAADSAAHAAVRLRQRNRLAGLRQRHAEAAAAQATARDACRRADAAVAESAAAEQAARAARRAAEPQPERARAALATLRSQAAQAEARLAAAAAALARAEPEATAAATAEAEARAALDAIADPAAARAAAEAARSAQAAARTEAAAAARALDARHRDDHARQARQRTLLAEQEDWRLRSAEAVIRTTDLRARQAELAAARDASEAAPGQTAARVAQATAAEAAALSAHQDAAGRSTEAAAASAAAGRSAQQADAKLAAAREAMLRAEAATTAAETALAAVLERVRATTTPLPGAPDLSPAAEAAARARAERARREFGAVGPVNLLAESAAAELEQAAALDAANCEELAAAVAKLRSALGHLNREGRERLAAIFAQVDGFFQALFARMFGGGRAQLALVGSDDPLEAGLEIYAQPPGKKLTSLTLLSGGEQALTALCLIFATFRCTPSPLCVLDEVDAPFDDANVARFCDLLQTLVAETGTRFLVITHHALTMARMDRLYGVTMQERGVSTLLGVDLETATAAVQQAAE